MFLRFLIIIYLFLLSACVSPNHAQELMAGKYAFQSGNYSEAFQKLLPVAHAGRPEAQYAIGYMYYYGYGVRQSISSGLEWMKRAAAQHYGPALYALNLIHRRENTKALKQDDIYPDENSLETFEVENQPDTMPDTMSVSVNQKSPTEALFQKSAQKMDSKRYVLQFYGSYHLEEARREQRHLRLYLRLHSSQIWHTHHQGKHWYVVTSRPFVTRVSAQQFKKQILSQFKSLSVWVRPVQGLERI